MEPVQQPQCGLCAKIFVKRDDLRKHICDEEAIKMYKDKPSKKSSNATASSDTIKDILAKNAPDPVSSPLEVKIDEKSRVTNRVTNEDNMMDVDKENTENFGQQSHLENRGNLLFPCTICPFNFCTTLELFQHHETVHKNSKTNSSSTCTHCKKKFANDKFLMQHVKAFHPKKLNAEGSKNQDKSVNTKIFKCTKCIVVFSNMESWVKHIKTRRKTDKILNCQNEKCTFGSCTKEDLVTHVKNCNSTKIILESNWDKKNSSNNSCIIYDCCKYCKEEKSISKIASHEKSCAKCFDFLTDDFVCKICEKRFGSRKFAYGHITKAHKAEVNGKLNSRVCLKITFCFL